MAHQHPEALLQRGLPRNSPAGHSVELKPAETQERHGELGGDRGELEALHFQTHKGRWMELLRFVHEEYPYCTMYGVHIADGVILCCENVQSSLTFGPDGAAGLVPAEFDEYWQTLETICRKIGKGSLLELRFSQGHPVSARRAEGGRRFRRFVQKTAKAQEERSREALCRRCPSDA